MSYYFHYLLRLRPIVVGSPLVFGSAMDLGLNCLLQQKMDGKPIDINAAKEIFEHFWTIANINGKDVDLRKLGKVKFSKSDLDESLLDEAEKTSDNPVWHSLRKKGLMMIEAYAEQVIPKIEQVHAIQHNISLKNELGDEFTGIVDFIATFNGKRYLMDNKTSSVSYKENSADESPQLGTYFEACKDEFKLDGVGYCVIPKSIRKKKEPRVEIELIFGTSSEELIAQTFQNYEQVLSNIKNGRYAPMSQEKCCENVFGCPYRQYIASFGTDMTGLEYIGKSK